eukprot:TRINITY_DN83290_c0_g1_i1.p1 TRINITY_DN83290_c0_g1~~TRINITY_DN83290_c0_g1_i1.p1  ORF type:complete len:462 (+),score=115.91 TRINITY_DN83290_c0_g1_i1:174-1559(+)
MVVTVREIYAGHDASDGFGDDAVAEAFLASGPSAITAYNFSEGGSLAPTKLPTVHLGPSPEEVAPPKEVIEETWEAVKDQLERTEDRLKLVLAKRAAAKAAQAEASRHASRATTSMSMMGPGSPQGAADYVPAAWPFPEEIPLGPPRRTPGLQEHRPPSFSSRGPSPAGSVMSRKGRPTPPYAFVDHVPAVWPFPEPIPIGPPARRREAASLSARGHSSSTQKWASSEYSYGSEREEQGMSHEGASRLSPPNVSQAALGTAANRREEETAFDEEAWFALPRRERLYRDPQKAEANAWIAQCAPKTWMLEHEKPLWMQRKIWFERDLKAKEAMFRNMPTMPFDLWLEMKQGLATSSASRETAVKARLAHLYEDNPTKGQAQARIAQAQLREAAKQEEEEMRTFYKELAAKRRQEMRASRLKGAAGNQPNCDDDEDGAFGARRTALCGIRAMRAGQKDGRPLR